MRAAGKKDPLAVGVDGTTVNLNNGFVRSIDKVDRRAGNSILFLMDACLEDVGNDLAQVSTHRGISCCKLGASTDGVEASLNLKVCTMVYRSSFVLYCAR